MSSTEWEEPNEDERLFVEALRQLAEDIPVSPDFCARVLAAARQAPPTPAAAESSAVPGAARPRRRFRMPYRLWPAVGTLAAGLCLSLAVNGWLTVQWRVHHADLTRQLAAFQEQTQREAQDNAALRHALTAAQAQVREAQAESRQWQDRHADLTRQLAAFQEQARHEASSVPQLGQGTDLRGRPYAAAELAVHKGGSGSGTVTSVPEGIHCGSSCTAAYASETNVTLKATPDPGSVFSGWSGDPGCAEGVTLTAGLTCTATFTLDAQAVQQLLAQQPCARVSVSLQAGVVDLGGRVTSTSQGADVRKMVESVKGVTQIKEKFETIPRPFCAVLEILEPIKKQADDRGIDFVTSLNKAGNIPDYYDKESLVITGTTPTKFESYV